MHPNTTGFYISDVLKYVDLHAAVENRKSIYKILKFERSGIFMEIQKGFDGYDDRNLIFSNTGFNPSKFLNELNSDELDKHVKGLYKVETDKLILSYKILFSEQYNNVLFYFKSESLIVKQKDKVNYTLHFY